MREHLCPVCKKELDISDVDKAGIEPCKSISCYQYNKQCNHCGKTLYFDAQVNAFKKLSAWRSLLNRITFSDFLNVNHTDGTN